MARIAHLSDLHFGEASDKLVADLGADIRAAAPDALAVSGDLTRRASRKEFAAALRFLTSLETPLLMVPGNHDIPGHDLWTRLYDPLGRWRSVSAAFPLTVLEMPGLRLVGLDTVARAQWHLDWSAGAISGERRQQLARVLGEGAVLVCHHPLRHAGWAVGRRPPRHAERTIELLTTHKVRAVLCGHLHRAEMTRLGEGGPAQIIAPSAFSERGGRANGWNLVVLEDDTLRVETRECVGGTWRGRDLAAV
ncbi:metallophosphoesterase family protein [Plastoroseomonas arctica]|uniref:Metallophosphoesterase n=1 Tax=Plastoroseomonas arctica TaxID=1509237 RepID=A0AAF1JXQ4_9PROT|nr:metallophosphoesterase [Plastoroseomonas arctica]MBR0655952.1 metallophosphoesterase [Plastoroseomonas arctica]